MADIGIDPTAPEAGGFDPAGHLIERLVGHGAVGGVSEPGLV